jgi:L,D-peptidoglycan transpeptidase YkuD (ErfK/YbiS/YcfS/YnhG family)
MTEGDTSEDIIVRGTGEGHLATLNFGELSAKCALGAAGITEQKREGDKATPAGRLALRRLWYRPDRAARPQTGLPVSEIRQNLGWSDDGADPDYNRLVRLPHGFGHEKLWRDDGLYDLFIELGWNDTAPQAGLGSAIFMHLEKNDFQPTLGCVAIARDTMVALLPHLSAAHFIRIEKA